MRHSTNSRCRLGCFSRRQYETSFGWCFGLGGRSGFSLFRIGGSTGEIFGGFVFVSSFFGGEAGAFEFRLYVSGRL